MADTFNPDAFLAQEAAPAIDTASFDPDTFLSNMERPSYANGLTPETALNQSPIDVADRAALSVGNEAGKMKFLKEKFGAVQKTKSGELVVNNKGFWQRVDPEGLGDGDAWSMTKELIADVTDLAPTAVNVAAQVGAGVAAAGATGGASLAAQAGISAAVGAALKAGETSLGRLVGTYEASPEEQLKDIGIETMLNLTGTVIAAGVQPAIPYIANGLSKFASLAKDSVGKKAFTEAWGTLTGAGGQNVERLIANPAAVTAEMKLAAKEGVDDVVGHLINKNVKTVGEIAKNVRASASSLYDSLADDVISQVDDSFKADIQGSVKAAYNRLAQMGAGELDQAGKFKLFSLEDMQARQALSGEINPLLADDKSYNIVAKMADKLGLYSMANPKSGKEGAKQIMSFRKIIGDLTYSLKEEADDAALAPAARIIAGVNEAIDNNVLKSFQLKTPVKSSVTGQMSDNLLLHTNEIYRKTLAELAPLTKAATSSMKQGGSDLPFQTLYNQLNSMQGRNTVQKSSFDSAIELLGRYGGEAGKNARNMLETIKDREAAAAFTPVFRKGLYERIGMGAAAGGGLMLNPALAGAAAGGVIASSPRIGKSIVVGALQLKNTLSKLAPAQRMQFLNTPQAIMQAVGTVMGIPQVQTQTMNELMQQGVSAAQGGQ